MSNELICDILQDYEASRPLLGSPSLRSPIIWFGCPSFDSAAHHLIRLPIIWFGCPSFDSAAHHLIRPTVITSAAHHLLWQPIIASAGHHYFGGPSFALPAPHAFQLPIIWFGCLLASFRSPLPPLGRPKLRRSTPRENKNLQKFFYENFLMIGLADHGRGQPYLWPAYTPMIRPSLCVWYMLTAGLCGSSAECPESPPTNASHLPRSPLTCLGRPKSMRVSIPHPFWREWNFKSFPMRIFTDRSTDHSRFMSCDICHSAGLCEPFGGLSAAFRQPITCFLTKLRGSYLSGENGIYKSFSMRIFRR